jgi:hypothetical protein
MTAGAPTIGGLKRLSRYLAGQLASAVAITGGTISGVTLSSASATITGGTVSGITSLGAAVTSVAATGTNQATAAPLTGVIHNVTAADGTKAVVLPAAAEGRIMYVYNSVATNGLPVFPGSGDAINGGSGDAAVTIEGKTLAIFIGTSASNWAAIYTADS